MQFGVKFFWYQFLVTNRSVFLPVYEWYQFSDTGLSAPIYGTCVMGISANVSPSGSHKGTITSRHLTFPFRRLFPCDLRRWSLDTKPVIVSATISSLPVHDIMRFA